jgi:RNA polymerase sigma-70 factor
MFSLAGHFFEAIPGVSSRDRRAAGEVTERLGDALGRARDQWPALVPDQAAFARYVGGCVSPKVDPVVALGRLNLLDLVLVSACLVNAKGAMAAFETTYRPEVVRLIRRRRLAPDLADEIWQALCTQLLVATAGRAPRLASYRGASPLRSFMIVCAERLVANDGRADRARDRLAERLAKEPTLEDRSPELSVIRHRYRKPFESALQAALGDLPPADRGMLELHLVARLSTARIGTMSRLGQTTVSRRLSRIRARVWEDVSARLRRDLGLPTDELKSITRALASQIDAAVSVILQRKKAGESAGSHRSSSAATAAVEKKNA